MPRTDVGMDTAFTPTDEQRDIISAFLSGDNLSIEACAGSGKTTVLRQMAKRSSGRGLYLAFNRHVAADARSGFPSGVVVATANSLAYRAFGVPRRHRLESRLPDAAGRRNAWAAVPYSDMGIRLSSWQVMHLGLRTVQAFCQSADESITDRHVAYPTMMTLDTGQRDRLAPLIRQVAERIWTTVQDPDADTPVTHDEILKLWALSHPRLDVDYILFDEAQDANPVLAGIVAEQTAQVITVGDSAQQLYGWRGAVDALDAFDGRRLPMTVSFRFGAAIAAEANHWLARIGDHRRITGAAPRSSVWLDHHSHRTPNAIICRTNAGLVSELLRLQRRGIDAGLVGGRKAQGILAVAQVAEDLMERHFTANPDFAAFHTWDQVVDHATSDECPVEIAGQVALVEQYGPNRLREAVSRAARAVDPTTVVTTCHQAKGREWRHVRIGDDFTGVLDMHRRDGLPPEEAMVNYVAVTRARRHLDAMAIADGRTREETA